MNSNDNGRAEARSQANRRLRRLTIGTAMLGVAATGTIGWLAAATYDGVTAAGTETAIVSEFDVRFDGHRNSDDHAIDDKATTTTPTVTTTTGSGHASSGGS